MSAAIRILSLLLLSLPLFLFAQALQGYEITGHINGLKDGEKVVMAMEDFVLPHAKFIPHDSGYVKNGEFVIKGIVPRGPRIYWMNFENGRVYRLFIDNGQHITLTYSGNVNKVPHDFLDQIITCDGSPTNFAFHLVWAIDDFWSQANSSLNHELKRIEDSIGYSPALVDCLMKAKFDLRRSMELRFLSPINTELMPGITMLGLYEGEDHGGLWQDIYDQMDDHLKGSVLGQKLKERLPLIEGAMMPSFQLPDAAGKPVSLQSIVTTGKITLVRFWASNSYERQRFDQELKALYAQYHNKGLNIVAVSCDTSATDWKKALQQQQYPWVNVLDVRGLTVVDTVFHERGAAKEPNTTNVLLDANGRIIAWDQYGLPLHWYLDKYLSQPTAGTGAINPQDGGATADNNQPSPIKAKK